MLKFTKLSETLSQIIYDVFDGLHTKLEQSKEDDSFKAFDNEGKEKKVSNLYANGFYQVKKNNFPKTYTYNFC